MKFRTIFILFNVVILTSFLFVFFLPLLLLGPESSLSFWKGNWYLALLFLALIAGLNSFFLVNRKTFVLVEREDWAELSAHLGGLMFPKGRFTGSRVRLLVNAYLLQSDIAGIESLEAERILSELDCDLFQGYYFAKPTIIVGKRLNPSQLALIRLLALVMEDAETSALESAFKTEPGLTVNMLRLTNSVSCGLSTKITSLRHAITILGRRQLQRWLQLLVYTNPKGAGQGVNPLLQLAATRGRLMELLAEVKFCRALVRALMFDLPARFVHRIDCNRLIETGCPYHSVDTSLLPVSDPSSVRTLSRTAHQRADWRRNESSAE